MSRHSKWANIKHRKGTADAKRATLFTKLSKNISVAARSGGDPEFNFSLRAAIDKALAANMTKDKVQHAIKRGTGEIAGNAIDEVLYEGFGPGGAAVLVEALTDNHNRTSASLRHIFSTHGGSLGSSGSVQWMFKHQGVVVASGRPALSDEEQLQLMDAGAEDITTKDGVHTIICADAALAKVRGAVFALGLTISEAELEWAAKEELVVSDAVKESLAALFEDLDDNEDVANIYSNVSF